SIPKVDLATWRLEISGLVENPMSFTWEEFLALPQSNDVSDIHCVTTWSKYDNEWQGVRLIDLFERVRPLPEAKHVIFHSYGGYTTNVPLDELQGPENMLAHSHSGEPLTPEHGAPLRGVVPNLYFW